MNPLLIYAEFFKIGLFSFGGGLATLPFLYDMASHSTWLKPEDIGNFLAVAQSSPGAIGVNVSAQTGYLAGGLPGAILAPLGLISPAIIIIAIVARVLEAFKTNKTTAAIFGGLRPAAAGLVAAAGFGVMSLSLFAGLPESAALWYTAIRWKETVLFALLFILVFKFKKHPILYIAAAGIAGALLGL